MDNISIYINPTNYGVINSRKYFNLLSKSELNEDEQKKVESFEKLMSESDKYRDYLVGSLKTNKEAYENGINNLAIMDSLSSESNLTVNEKRAIDAYNKQKQSVLEYKENKVKKLEKKSDVSSGYINAFILILSSLATGLFIGFALLMFTK